MKIKSMGAIKKALETEVIAPLQTKLDFSMRYMQNESEFQVEIQEWIKSLSKITLEIENHINQLDS